MKINTINLMKYKALMDTHQDTFGRMNKAIPLRPSTSPPPVNVMFDVIAKVNTRQKGYTARRHFYYYLLKSN